MNILIRADASVQLGTGHIMRCFTLAKELKKSNIHITFVCKDYLGNMCEYLEANGFPVYRLPLVNWEEEIGLIQRNKDNNIAKFDWLIVDNYSLDGLWETAMKKIVNKVMVIDDLANRSHVCDILLDQNLYFDADNRYNNLLPDHCIRLLGPHFSLLREEFRIRRNTVEKVKRLGTNRRILVCFGGTDPTNETKKVLEAIKLSNIPEIVVDVVVGVKNPHISEIKELCSCMSNINLIIQAENMAYLMADAELAICSGGTLTWERYCMGLPAVIIAVADNQIKIAEASDQYGVDKYIGESKHVSIQTIRMILLKLLKDKGTLVDSSEKAKQMVDGYGVNRVATKLINYN